MAAPGRTESVVWSYLNPLLMNLSGNYVGCLKLLCLVRRILIPAVVLLTPSDAIMKPLGVHHLFIRPFQYLLMIMIMEVLHGTYQLVYLALPGLGLGGWW